MNKTVEEYIDSQPKEQRKVLEKIRALVKSMIPKAEEAMGYGVASFKLNSKPLIYYASFKNHIGIYPVPKAEGKLAEKIKKHQTGKGTLQFPLNEPIPYGFIKQVIKIREDEVR